MADQEVIKHTKKVVNILSDKHNGWLIKLKDFAFEVIIIVFAVSLSIWLHERSEHSHQQKEVKDFLLGLRDDLVHDTVEMQSDKHSFLESKAGFGYLASLGMSSELSVDSFTLHSAAFTTSTGLVPNIGRFEGFKSSGKMGAIENTVLQNDIMDLYQEDIPSLLSSSNNYGATKMKFWDYLNEHTFRTSDSTQSDKAFTSDYVHNISIALMNTDQIISRYDSCIHRIRKIISEIDRTYKE